MKKEKIRQKTINTLVWNNMLDVQFSNNPM
jgi:hypothetical protein